MTAIRHRRRWVVIVVEPGGLISPDVVDAQVWPLGTCWTRLGAQRAANCYTHRTLIMQVVDWEAQMGRLETVRG